MLNERRSLESIMRRFFVKSKLIAVLFLTNVTICSSVKVTIFYEALCPDCVDFFVKQFNRCWHQFGDAVTWEMVPFGNGEEVSNASDETVLECQHGYSEYEANAIQACLLSKISDLRVLSFISCYMQRKDKTDLGLECGKQYKINYDDMYTCGRSEEGFQLLLRHKGTTEQILPKERFIPAIAFDDHYTAEDSEEGRLNLVRAICRRLKTNKPCICNGI